MNINVLGFGVMARQISALLCLLGFDVTVWDKYAVDLKLFNFELKKLKKSLSLIGEGTIKIASDLSSLENNLTIESIIEDLDAKRDVYGLLKDKISFYCSNTSSYSPLEIGEKVNGLHFFNPISIKIVELCQTTFDDSFLAFRKVLETNGYSFVEVKSNRGYVGNYFVFKEISAFFELFEKHRYSLDSIEAIYGVLSQDKNILKMIDLIGVDVTYNILVNLNEENGSFYVPQALAMALKKNILGRKNKTSLKKFLVELGEGNE